MWPFKSKKPIPIVPEDEYYIVYIGNYSVVKVRKYWRRTSWPDGWNKVIKIIYEDFYLRKNINGIIILTDLLDVAEMWIGDDSAIEGYGEYLSQQEQEPMVSLSRGESNDI